MRPPTNPVLATPAHALYTSAEIRAIEQAAIAALPDGTLMRRAGQAAAELALSLIDGSGRNSKVLVVAGPGNNGGDALEAAARMADAGCDITIVLLAEASQLPPDARQALQRAQKSKARFQALPIFFAEHPSANWVLVIDGMFGIGLTRPITGAHRMVVEAINALACPVLALDTPSGLDVDTGALVAEGGNGCAVRATHTLTFIADKPGLHTAGGRDQAGAVHVADLDIDHALFTTAQIFLNQPSLFAAVLQARRHDTHKGSFGDVIVIGGALGMTGAPVLAARAAARCGAGRVFAAFVEQAPAYDACSPELMFRLAGELEFLRGVLVIGPGLGTSSAARDLLLRAITSALPLVLDADALNLIAGDPALQRLVAEREGGTLLTPHPLEAARLLGLSSDAVQGDRINAAQRLAHDLHATVVLKGSGTVIASPDRSTVINPTGNPALASAGTGDVLAGVCGVLLAQHPCAHEAALAAVWLHGAAADELLEQGIGPVGLTASELIDPIRAILNRLIAKHQGN